MQELQPGGTHPFGQSTLDNSCTGNTDLLLTNLKQTVLCKTEET